MRKALLARPRLPRSERVLRLVLTGVAEAGGGRELVLEAAEVCLADLTLRHELGEDLVEALLTGGVVYRNFFDKL